MWIDGHNYKSLNFTVLEDKLKDLSKEQTCRVLFIPSYEVGETIAISFKKEFLYLAMVTDLYAKKLSELTQKEAELDGFDSVLIMQKAILFLNNIKSINHWCFITKFKKIPDIYNYL